VVAQNPDVATASAGAAPTAAQATHADGRNLDSGPACFVGPLTAVHNDEDDSGGDAGLVTAIANGTLTPAPPSDQSDDKDIH
jgi:hypothetical protein